MKLSKASLFALFAVLELAGDPERHVSTAGIADKYGISSNHLAKIMRTLIHKGLVQSMRGASGGCRFVGSVDRTTLFDIIQLFETLGPELDIPLYDNLAGSSIIEEIINISREINDHTTSVLNSITLATALKNYHQSH
jgi:Rrf2 family protein